MKNIYQHILQYIQVGNPVVLATVTRASGSTPQKPGSSALFGMNGLLTGTVGGGLVEGEITSIVQKSFKNKDSGHYHFILDADQGEEGAICGGKISVLVDGNPEAHMHVFEEMERSLKQNKSGGLLTKVKQQGNEQILIRRSWITLDPPVDFLPDTEPGAVIKIMEGIRHGKPGELVEIVSGDQTEREDQLLFLEPVHPLPRLIIAGAGHIGKAVTHLGHLLDFEVTVIDDRQEYANSKNLPEADHIVVGDIGKRIAEIHFDNNTYIVIVTRGHEHDADALRPCIGSSAAYTGMIGSANKVATLRKRFLSESWATQEQWQKIRTPIGLDIGSKSVQEIAISIAAQLVQERNKRNGSHG